MTSAGASAESPWVFWFWIFALIVVALIAATFFLLYMMCAHWDWKWE